MFKEIQHHNTKTSVVSLKEFADKIIETNELIEKSKLTVNKLFSNKNTDVLFDDSIKYLQKQIKELNVQRKSFFNKNGFLPAEFHHTLGLINNKLTVVEDSTTFKNVRYSISVADVQKICDEKGLMVIPYSAVKNNMKMEDGLSAELDIQKNIFVLMNVSKLNLNDCLKSSEKELVDAIVPSILCNKWESFLFQLPLFQEIKAQLGSVKNEIDGLKNSFNRMNEMMMIALEKQENFNTNVYKNFDKILKELNNVARFVHEEKGLHKDKMVKVQDFKNPYYERVEEGVGEYETDAGYTNYKSVIIRYVERFPLINVKVYGVPYQNVSLDSRVNPNLSEMLGKYMNNSSVKNKELFEKAKLDGYMILKKDSDNEFKVVTTMRGVDNVMALMLNQELLSSTI